jgi:sodium transport system permease protein
MKWSTVKLIFQRELRDQLRDRRTLFTVAVLPLLLYPLMGMALLQVAQFMREHPTNLWVIGAENLPQSPALIVDGQIDQRWTGRISPDLLKLHFSAAGDQQYFSLINEFKNPASENSAGAHLVDELIQQEMRTRKVDLAIFVPTQLAKQVNLPGTAAAGDQASPTNMPTIYLFVNSASDKSKIASDRFASVLSSWQQAITFEYLATQDISVTSMRPFEIAQADVADTSEKQAAVWSKILPLIIMIWSLTGAFYPAVDLCAGEKERGTFETLLSSPAHRTDLAIGKLLTVMAFSIATSILNLISMGFTGFFVYSRMGNLGGGVAAAMGPPPVAAVGWLLLALVPISALFSAMALAAAAFARSSKEGQYYLIPLMMICMPLMMVPMLPAAELDLGTSLIPVSGLMLMLRGLIEGQYAHAAQFAGPVCAVTLVCCWLAIRWVVRQFNSETVLFRASERFGIGLWFKHVMHERHDLPSFGSALICALVVLMVKFFIGFALQAPGDWAAFAKQTIIVLVATVAVPALLMALILTRNAIKSLRLRACRMPVAAAAILTAICLHPLMMWFTALVMHMYPPAGDLVQMQQVVGHILADAPNIWVVLLVFAVAPAVMEELAYRGFILSGFESLRNNWAAVLLTSLLFGLAHSVLQQSIITFVVGVVLGWIAIKTKSLWPCVLYHATHNALTVVVSVLDAPTVGHSQWLGAIFQSTDGESFQYNTMAGILMSIVGVLLLAWLIKGNDHSAPQNDVGRFDLGRLFAKLKMAGNK